MTPQPQEKRGHVCLVGAGPGDPELITQLGLRLLRAADVVVYDALANPALLDEAPPHARLIDVGKRARDHRLTQDEINDLLVEQAMQGGLIVRLKGGDPYLFGRGAEEAAYLGRHGIPCQVVPGITSGIAAPMAAGIPVTHRQLASTVTFVTGHEDPTKHATAIDYAALARLIAVGGTVCFYMAMGRLHTIARTLIEHGLDARTPAAAVQWGTLPRQRQARAPLGRLADAVAAQGVGAPAIVVVGAVAGLEEPGLEYFLNRPLFGKTVLITRTRHQASQLRQQLVELGAEVLEAPTIELVPPADWDAVDQTLRDLHQYDWLVLTSANGVDALADRLDALGLDGRHFAGVKLAAVGDTTAEAIRHRLGLRADLVPTQFVAESLASELIAREAVAGQRFLLLRADIARPALPRLLAEAGAQVSELAIYETRLAANLPAPVLEALRERRVDWITFTSSSTASNLVELLGEERELIEHARLASIGPVTSDTLRRLGLTVAVEAVKSNIPGLILALAEAEAERV